MRSRSTTVNRLSPEEVRNEEVDTLFMEWLVARSTTDLLDAVLRPAGLTGDEFAVYSVLSSDEAITPTELARWMAAPATTVSSVVKRLESRGHAVREKHPDDGRSYRIRLTDAGRAAHAQAVDLFRPVSADVTENLGEDASRVDDALLRLRDAVDRVREAYQADDAARRG